jgi:hypothetical protein
MGSLVEVNAAISQLRKNSSYIQKRYSKLQPSLSHIYIWRLSHNHKNAVGAFREIFDATSFKSLPKFTRSKSFTPPPFVPPAIRYLSSGPPNCIARTCVIPVLTSATSSSVSGFSIAKIDMMSPSGDGSFRFER